MVWVCYRLPMSPKSDDYPPIYGEKFFSKSRQNRPQNGERVLNINICLCNPNEAGPWPKTRSVTIFCINRSTGLVCREV